MEDDQKNQSGRRPNQFRMEDNQKNSKWKTTKTIKKLKMIKKSK